MDKHHVYGAANRSISEKYGLTVYLCHNECHENGERSVHKNAEVNTALKKEVQQIAMKYYKWTEADFIKIFGKSYLSEGVR